MTRSNAELRAGIEQFTPKRWITAEEFHNKFSDDSDRKVTPEEHQFALDYLNQGNIMTQISKNASEHLVGMNSDGTFASWYSRRWRDTPEKAAADDQHRADALARTVKLIAPYGGTEAHANILHKAAREEDEAAVRRSELHAEDSAGVNGLEGLQRAYGMGHSMEEMFGRRLPG